MPARRLVPARVAALIPVLAAAALPALAQAATPPTAQSSAVLTGLLVQVFDLDPGDGIAASVSFAAVADGVSTASVLLNRSSDGTYLPEQRTDLSAAMFGTLNATLDGHGGLASGAASTSSTGSAAQAIARGSFGQNTSDGTSAWAISSLAELGNYPAWNFTVTPLTRVVFSAFGEISGEVVGTGHASAEVRLWVLGPSLPGSTTGQQSAEASLRFTQFDDGSFSRSGALDVSFRNLSAQPLSGMIDISTDASVFSYQSLSPIPEPATWATTLLGLAVLGSRAWRRRGAGEPRP